MNARGRPSNRNELVLRDRLLASCRLASRSSWWPPLDAATAFSNCVHQEWRIARCQFPDRAFLKEFVPLAEAARTRGIKMFLAGLPNGEWHDLNLLRKVIGGREIGVAVYEDAADDEHRIGRRRYLLRAALGEVDVKRIIELQTVEATGEARHVCKERLRLRRLLEVLRGRAARLRCRRGIRYGADSRAVGFGRIQGIYVIADRHQTPHYLN